MGVRSRRKTASASAVDAMNSNREGTGVKITLVKADDTDLNLEGINNEVADVRTSDEASCLTKRASRGRHKERDTSKDEEGWNNTH